MANEKLRDLAILLAALGIVGFGLTMGVLSTVAKWEACRSTGAYAVVCLHVAAS
ncbi:hypothetical protein [Methylobacterium sp.]|uniref:hypothetical protein n=1 Tax=Methylobacterium sp. TaxID=409 RepID=UPI0025F11514|nr:hypothetical protein [Methylobacterium sp.]MBY0258557.1 hypothetical protein [Methylobacterium sp.]